jgi:hypothetical protein
VVFKKSEQYEKVVKRIYEFLSPGNKVTQNDSILGKDSKVPRQIDVSIRGVVGGHEILIVVECKDTKRKVDVKEIEALCTKLKDVSANKGVLISNSGFSSGARRLAAQNGIDLFSVHDAEEKDWKLELKFPIIWEEISPHISGEIYMVFEDQVSTNQFNVDANACFNIGGVNWFPKFKYDWETGAIPVDDDKYVYDPGIKNPSIRFKDGTDVRLKSFVLEMNFKRSYYLGFFDDLPTAKALKNEMNGSVQTLLFSTDVHAFDKSKLIYLPTKEKLAINPKTHIKILLRPAIGNWQLKAFSVDGPEFHMRREINIPMNPTGD